MPTSTELRTHRATLTLQRSSGVARVSYDGKTVDYRAVAEINRDIEALDRQIATADTRKEGCAEILKESNAQPWSARGHRH